MKEKTPEQKMKGKLTELSIEELCNFYDTLLKLSHVETAVMIQDFIITELKVRNPEATLRFLSHIEKVDVDALAVDFF